MKLLNKLKNTFLYMGNDRETYKEIEQRINSENRMILIIMSAVVFVILLAISYLNTVSTFLNTSSLFYVAGAVVEAAVLILALTVAKKHTKFVPFLMEINLVIVYAICVAIATFGSSEDEPTVTFFVVMIFMPLILIGRPITFTITNVVATIAFIYLDQFKLPDVFSRDLTNALVYLVLGTAISTWLIQTRVGNKKLAYDLEKTGNELAESYGIVEGLNSEFLFLFTVNEKTLETKLVRYNSNSNQLPPEEFRTVQKYGDFFTQYVAKYVSPKYRESFAEAVQLDKIISNIKSGTNYSYNYGRICNDGNIRYYQITFAPIVSKDGINNFVFGFRDIDETVHEEQEKQRILQDALNAAEYANKAKTTFLNNMSHDIRTPMNAIVGFTALAATHIDNKEQVQDYLKKITTSGQHLLSLINDILDMSRIESGKMKIEEKPVHLPEILHNLRNIIQVSITGKQQNLFIDTVDVENEDVICDPLRLNQVLLNLISNAIKYTQPGGYISIRLTQKPSENPKYGKYEFRVKDNGIGMSKEFAARIFDSFAREENSTVSKIQGTGLGMAITKSIVDMMGGTIQVETEKGKGTEVIVEVSLLLSGDITKEYTVPALKDIHALVVDDDSHCCISVSDMLRKIGLRPDWTLSGHEAVLRTEVAKKQGDSYGVFIIDYFMPDMNGVETVRRIRHVIGNETPIIVLTSYDWSDVEQEAREAGVTAFVSKPLFMSELRDVLSKPFCNTVQEEETKEAEVSFEGQRILLVEDNELNREIAITLLSDYGLIIDEAEDGSIAVDMIKKAESDKYKMILMDIQMPIMDGYEATKQIRAMEDQAKANIPIVAMTANAFDDDRKLALNSGMNGHLAKPIDISAVLSMLTEILKK